MPTKRLKATPKNPQGLEHALAGVATKLSRWAPLRKGHILVRATGPGGGHYCLEASGAGVRVVTDALPDAPEFEVLGDAKRIEAIIAGRKAALPQFLAGGFRIRGDLRYFSDLALELGILKQPL